MVALIAEQIVPGTDMKIGGAVNLSVNNKLELGDNLRLPASYGAKITKIQTPLVHFAQ